MQRDPTIFISVAEPSADMHAAALVRAARHRWPQSRWYGLTGPQLRATGVDTIFDFVQHAAMLGGVLKLVGKARGALRAIEAAWDQRPPNLVIVCDSAALHLRVARAAKQRGLPVLYYIAPQTWASRAYRNRALARHVDRLACILPFEADYFQNAGVHATFVGHPLFETLRTQSISEHRIAAWKQPNLPLVAILPGSRAGVVAKVLPHQLRAAATLHAKHTPIRVAISVADRARRLQIETLLQKHQPANGPTVELVENDNATLLNAADLALVASGTATLETAYRGTPLLVLYDAGPVLGVLHRWLGRFVIHARYLALINILANAEIAPEFMPRVPAPARVASAAAELLCDESKRDRMRAALRHVCAPLEESAASERTCDLMAELLFK